jgi:hypothetical protein
MSENVELEKVRRNVRHSYFEDGLVDIVLGTQLMLLSLFLQHRSLSFVVAWAPLALGIVEVVRRRTTYPRIGYVKLPQSSALLARVLILGAVGMMVCLGVAALGRVLLGLPVAGHWNVTAGLAAAMFIPTMFGVLAYQFRVPRWFVYGLLVSLVFMTARQLDAPHLVSALGIVVTVVGVAVFIGFLRKYRSRELIHGRE